MRIFLATLSTALIVLLAALVPLGAIAAWSDLQIGDTDRFVSTMAPLASDPAVQDAVTNRVTGEVLKHVGPGPVRDAVHDPLHAAVRSFTTTQNFRTAWTAAARAAHSAAGTVLASDSRRAVTIDLAEITDQVKQQLLDEGVPLARQIPIRHAEITLLAPARLDGWREVAQVLRAVGIWPAAATLPVASLAVLTATRRRRALIGTGLAFALGGALLAAAVALGRSTVLDDLPTAVDGSAAGAVYDALTASLRVAAWATLAAGLALAVAASLAGPAGRSGLGRLRGALRAEPAARARGEGAADGGPTDRDPLTRRPQAEPIRPSGPTPVSGAREGRD